MDGFILSLDCDDGNPNINPAVRETITIGWMTTAIRTPSTATPMGWLSAAEMNGPDCNDRSATMHPDAEEVPYNGADDDCNLTTPDDDLDLDGVELAEDCDDTNRIINPNAIENARENCGDGIDHDCRGGDVRCEEFLNDDDGDGNPMTRIASRLTQTFPTARDSGNV